MIRRSWVEAYLRFLLRNRLAVTLVIAVMTLFFAYQCSRIKIIANFIDFYPSASTITIFGKEIKIRDGHPYINIYNDFRRMFGSANVLTAILEVKHGDIYNPTTLQKLDQMTRWMTETKGVVPYQIASIAHPKMKSITTVEGAIQIREVFYPGVPKTQADADRVKFAVYATKGIRGIYVSEDDTAALVNAGFWEEDLDVDYLWHRMQELKAQVEDDNHTVYFTGFPWLQTSILRYVPEVRQVFLVTCAALTFLLWNYFRSWPGVWVPMFSGVLSCVWALGLVPLLGLNLDPLILVVPVFLSARALSHSVQSMDRYHEEYHRTHDRHTAIVESYSHLFPPAIVSILNDAAGLFLVTMAPIPIIQKVALFSCFWIFSILVSVVTLHPIILSATRPPGVPSTAPRWLRILGQGVLDPPGRRLRRGLPARGVRPDGRRGPRGHARRDGRALPVARADLQGHHRADHRRQRRVAALGGSGPHHRALHRVPVLRLAAEGGRHDPRLGAALPEPPVQRGLRQAEREVRRRQPPGRHRRHRQARRHEERRRRSPPWRSSPTTWRRRKAPASP